MSFHHDPPPPSGEDWETSLFIHAKRFPVKKALQLAQSLDFGFSPPVPVAPEPLPEAEMLPLPPVPELDLFTPPEPPMPEVDVPRVLMPPHVGEAPAAKVPQRPTAPPLPPIATCFEDDFEAAAPPPYIQAPEALTPMVASDNEAAFEVFLRTLLSTARADVPPVQPAAVGAQTPLQVVSPVYQATMPVMAPVTASVSIEPSPAGMTLSFATTGPMAQPPLPVASTPAATPEPVVEIPKVAAPPMAPPVVLAMSTLTQAESEVFRVQTVPTKVYEAPDAVLPLIDLFLDQPVADTVLPPESPEADGDVEAPVLSLVPPSEPAVPEMGTVLPFRRESAESEDESVLPFPVKPMPTYDEIGVLDDIPDIDPALEENPPVPEALTGFSLEFPDFSLDDDDDWGMPAGPLQDIVADEAPAQASVQPVLDAAASFEALPKLPEFAVTPLASDISEPVPSDEPAMVPYELPDEEPLPVIEDALPQWETELDLDALLPEASPEDELDILASAPLGDEFQMLLVHLDGLYALMVDNGENAVLLKTFDANPLSGDEAFMVSEEAILETGKAMFLAHVGDWQGIIALEGDDATIQAEMPWSND